MKFNRNFAVRLLILVIVLFAIYTLGISTLLTEKARSESVIESYEVHSFFYDSKNDRIATVSLMDRGYYSENVMFFRFHVWHREGGRLRSLKVTISPNVSAEVYLKTPDGYPWNPLKLQRSKDNPNSVTLEIPDLGFQGEGSVTLDFVVVPLGKVNTISITVKTEFELSEGFKKYIGECAITLPLKNK
ncbi:hypothetical protein K1720_05055 [Thermococcus argininiproducens]|uniref:DUF8121 domain-containing protein n=2 Tax=Thermococcus argininiproducens TaxID=2866384 RepID=A0A9E7SEF8_9EURY|nr:hypothetical protein K1720_05055 [Thermococcus argininiproducens]